MKYLINLLILVTSFYSYSQQVGILHYSGGGDWYANPTAIPNLIKFTNQECKTSISKNIAKVKPTDIDLFNYPILFMTGHGNVFFSDEDVENLQNYLKSGGFIHISDNYGLDKYIRKELKKIFPSSKLQNIPRNHDIYHQSFKFPGGIPKIHEHDKKQAQGLGIFHENRLVIYYDYESDLSDGWEDQSVHNNPESTRLKALRMGANIIEFSFKN